MEYTPTPNHYLDISGKASRQLSSSTRLFVWVRLLLPLGIRFPNSVEIIDRERSTSVEFDANDWSSTQGEFVKHKINKRFQVGISWIVHHSTTFHNPEWASSYRIQPSSAISRLLPACGIILTLYKIPDALKPITRKAYPTGIRFGSCPHISTVPAVYSGNGSSGVSFGAGYPKDVQAVASNTRTDLTSSAPKPLGKLHQARASACPFCTTIPFRSSSDTSDRRLALRR